MVRFNFCFDVRFNVLFDVRFNLWFDVRDCLRSLEIDLVA
jgi:hypothetical protein